MERTLRGSREPARLLRVRPAPSSPPRPLPPPLPPPHSIEPGRDHQFSADVLGVAHSTNAFLPLLRKGAAKKIITLSSGLAEVDFNLTAGVTSHPAYAIAKTALNMLVARYANELRPDGFVVLAISPGLVDTSGTREEKGESLTPPGISSRTAGLDCN